MVKEGPLSILDFLLYVQWATHILNELHTYISLIHCGGPWSEYFTGPVYELKLEVRSKRWFLKKIVTKKKKEVSAKIVVNVIFYIFLHMKTI